MKEFAGGAKRWTKWKTDNCWNSALILH